MSLNRHQRRALAKANGLKNIPGSNRIHLKNALMNKMREKGMPQDILDFYDSHNRMPSEIEFNEMRNGKN